MGLSSESLSPRVTDSNWERSDWVDSRFLPEIVSTPTAKSVLVLNAEWTGLAGDYLPG